MHQTQKAAGTPQAEPKKKPPAHEVICRALRGYVTTLVLWDDTGVQLSCSSSTAIMALAAVLEEMEIPKQHRSTVVAELRRLHARMHGAFSEPRKALKEAANAIIRGSITKRP